MSNKKTGPNQPEDISIEDQARYRELEKIIEKNFATFAEVNTRQGEYMRPFSPEEIRIHTQVGCALGAMELHSLYRVAGFKSCQAWLDSRPYANPPKEVQDFLKEVVDDRRLVAIVWNMAAKKAGNYYPTMRQLKSAAKKINRLCPKWLKEGRACQKVFQEGIANGEVIVNVHLIE